MNDRCCRAARRAGSVSSFARSVTIAAASFLARSGNAFAASDSALRSRRADCLLNSGILSVADSPASEFCIGGQLRDFRQTEHFPPLVNGFQNIGREQRRNLQVSLQGIPVGLHESGRRPV